MSKEKSDGSHANYYLLPKGATQLQHLISYRNQNAQIGEIFRACYRYGLCGHSDEVRDIKKILFYAQAELERLEKLESIEVKNCVFCIYDKNISEPCLACKDYSSWVQQ